MTKNAFEALKASRLGAELTEEQCKVLAKLCEFRDLEPREILVREGTTDNELYLVLSGNLGVVRNAGGPNETTLITMSPGDFADEMSFLDGTEHYASLVALGKARILGLEREKLESLIKTHPEIVYRVMRAIIRAVHQIQRRLSMQSVELMNYIYKQHGRY